MTFTQSLLQIQLPEMLQFGFMQRAFVVGIILALLTSCIGMIVVLKRLSLMGDALSHASLAGVACGLLLQFNPIVGAMGAAVFAGFGIECLRRLFHRYSEIGIAIVLSTGIGFAGILSGFIKQSANFNSFLFGSIVTIEPFEFYLVLGIGISVLILFFVFYKELFYLTFDEEGAALSGLPVRLINWIFTLFTALTIAIAARAVGSLVISSLLVLPVAGALQLHKSFRATCWISMGLSLLYTLLGLTLSYTWNLKPGSTIILLSVLGFLILALSRKITQRFQSKQSFSSSQPT